MNLPYLIFKFHPKKITSILLTGIYVLISGYVVISHEYLGGNFFFKFFPSSLLDVYPQYFDKKFVETWYGNINKIVFPVCFFAVTIGFAIAQNIINKSHFSYYNARQIFRFAFIFHFYLLLSTYTTEIVPGFSIMPGEIPSGELLDYYRQVFVGIFFVAYYVFWIQSVKSFRINKNRWIQSIITFSPLALTFSPIYSVHLYCFLAALLAWPILSSSNVRLLLSPKSNLISNYLIYFVLALGLFFRIKYATFFSLNGEGLVLLNADGGTYLGSAKGFQIGDLKNVSFYQAPLYSYYLSWFLGWFGSEVSSIFYSQAVVGSALPWAVYKIVRTLDYPRASLIAAILTATDPLCIHYSIAINRSALLILALTLLVLFNLLIYKKPSSLRFFLLGALVAATFYLGQETLPILLGMGGGMFYISIKKKPGIVSSLKSFLTLALGFLFICVPINRLFYNLTGKWILVGRNASERHSPSFFYKSSPPVEKMIELGFNPIDHPLKSLVVWIENPVIVTFSIIEKLWLELPGFLFDPEAVYFAPLHLSMESFYGANIQFYIYFFLIAGIFYLLTDRKLMGRSKGLILGTILCQAIMTSIFIFGASRFRAPVVPLNLILSSIGMWKILFERKLPILSKINSVDRVGEEKSIFSKKIKKLVWTASLTCLLITLPIIFFSQNSSLVSFTHSSSPWMFVNKDSRHARHMDINTHAISIIDSFEDPNNYNLEISIPACNFLIPGERPFYMLSIDGIFIGEPKRVPRGCGILRSKLPLTTKRGILSIYFYFSEDNNLILNQPIEVLINYKKQKLPLVFFQSFTHNLTKLMRQNTLFYQKHSKRGLVLGQIRINRMKRL
jgi:hypothetical protein